MSELHVELVAADGKIWEGSAHQVSARGIEGEVGILPGHSPLLTVLAPGEIRIEGGDSGGRKVSVEGGFMSVDRDRVTIVSETVVTSASN